MGRHPQHLVLDQLHLALARRVAEDDDTTERRPSLVVDRCAAKAQDTSPIGAKLRFDLAECLATSQRLDDGLERVRHGARRGRPLPPLHVAERLAKQDCGVVDAQHFACGAVQAHDATRGVDDEQRVGHARQNRLQLGNPSLQLAIQALRATQVSQRARDLLGRGLEKQQIVLIVGMRSVALD